MTVAVPLLSINNNYVCIISFTLSPFLGSVVLCLRSIAVLFIYCCNASPMQCSRSTVLYNKHMKERRANIVMLHCVYESTLPIPPRNLTVVLLRACYHSPQVLFGCDEIRFCLCNHNINS